MSYPVYPNGYWYAMASRSGLTAVVVSTRLGDGVLGQTGAGASLEHSVGNLVLKGEGVVFFDKALAGRRPGEEFLVAVADGFEFEVRHRILAALRDGD